MNAKRLLNIQKENDNAGIEMLFEAGRFQDIKNSEKTEAISSFNLFQTPEAIADKMVNITKKYIIKENLRVLEPSAGLGRLYKPIVKSLISYDNISLIEQDKNCCKYLYNLTKDNSKAKLYQRDFLTFEDEKGFDLVVMNPPFKMGVDIKHIDHAFSLLAPGGVLVSLCAAGAKREKAFKDKAVYWEELPTKSFKSEGTNVNAVLLVVQI